jgi:hypothetical protein
MEELKQINLSPQELKNLPLFYRKIFYNLLTNVQEEEKLMKYTPDLLSKIMRDDFSTRAISKTINHKIFLKNENE